MAFSWVKFSFHLIKLMWPKFRCKKAERERDLADEANRLFKQEFGDKIESLQQEVEQLRRQRYWDLLLWCYIYSGQPIWFVSVSNI